MIHQNVSRLVLAAVMLLLSARAASAISIEMVTVGNAGNAADTTGYGKVNSAYAIDKYEITAGQYRDFLNAVATSDPYELYNTFMDSDSSGCQITRTGPSGSYWYDFSGRPSGVESDWANRPVNYVSWGDAARFANWLSNGELAGLLTGIPAQDRWLTEDGSYFLNGAMSNTALMAVTRKTSFTWVIPTENEWYKAAYHDRNAGLAASYFNYPMGTSEVPNNGNPEGDTGNSANFYDGDWTVGPPYYRTVCGFFPMSGSPYGTFDQGGNVWEWNETNVLESRGVRGGAYNTSAGYLHKSYRDYDRFPADEKITLGFRVALVPEPGSIMLLVAGAISLLAYAWRRRKRAA